MTPLSSGEMRVCEGSASRRMPMLLLVVLAACAATSATGEVAEGSGLAAGAVEASPAREGLAKREEMQVAAQMACERVLQRFEDALPAEVFRRSKRSARIYEPTIIILFVVSIVAMILLFVYHVVFSQREEIASKGMVLVRSVDKCVVGILRKWALTGLPDTRFRGISEKHQTVHLSFEDLGATLKKGGFRRERIQVLAGVTGSFRPGRITAIMGPSGAGKTTLLNVLCGKAGASSGWEVSGRVRVNEAEDVRLEDLKPVTGFVPQDDIVHERLTVRENIKFSAKLRNQRHTSRALLQRITNDVLQALQLEAQQGIVVGNRAKGESGLSGGQRKRVNIGLELAACPTLLFLDEPTSGLDATSSLILVEQLKQMAKLGMTIVMVVHQPRYSLFTLIDDVLLLGKGGKTVFAGATNDAKSYFESLGFSMPECENPADWFMDVISGQTKDSIDDFPNDQLPELLFTAWESAPPERRCGSNTIGRRITINEDRDVIRRHVMDEWSKVAHGANTIDATQMKRLLHGCLGTTPSDAVVVELMNRLSRGRGHSVIFDQRQSPKPTLTVHRHDFFAYLLSFYNEQTTAAFPRSDNEDNTSSSSEDSDVDAEADYSVMVSDDLNRRLPGFWKMLAVVVHRRLIQWWRRQPIRILFWMVIEFAAIFLGVFDRFIFDTPAWMPTGIMNAHISIALLTCVYCLTCFSEDQPIFWRESSHGLNKLAFFIGQTLVDAIDWLLMSFFFTSMYYMFLGPQLPFSAYYLPYVLVAYVASGWGYLISTTVPPILGPFAAAVVSFMLGGILGLPDKMGIFLTGGFLETMVSVACFTRWSVPMDFITYIERFPQNKSNMDMIIEAQLELYSKFYRQAHWRVTEENSDWWTGIVALLIMGTVLRMLAFVGLCLVNRDKQL